MSHTALQRQQIYAAAMTHIPYSSKRQCERRWRGVRGYLFSDIAIGVRAISRGFVRLDSVIQLLVKSTPVKWTFLVRNSRTCGYTAGADERFRANSRPINVTP